MKKQLFTLLTLLVMCVTGAWADEHISCSAYLSGTAGSPTTTDCSIVYYSDEGSAGTLAAGSQVGSTSYYAAKMNNDKNYYEITLNKSAGGNTYTKFKAGDVITVYLQINSGTQAYKVGKTAQTAVSASNSKDQSNVAGVNHTLTAAEIESNGTLRIYRNSSNTYFAGISVEGTRSGAEKTPLAGAWSAAAPKFVTGSVATIPTFALTNTPAVAAENYTITYSVQSGNLANVNASTGITAINTAEAGTATVRATLALTAAGEAAYVLPDPAYYDCVITVENPKVATPSLVLPVGSYDYEKGGYKFQVSCATEGATYSYKLKGAPSFTELTTYSEGGKDYVYMVGDGSKNIIIKASKAGLPDSEEVEISKWDGSNAFVLNVAPSTTSPESIVTFSTSADQYDKDQLHQYRSFNVAGTYIAGIDGSDGLKMRCNRTFTIDDTNIQGFALAVTPGYQITKVEITKLISNRAGTISADAMYVDGASYAGFESFTIPASDGTPVTKTYDGLNATSQIAWKLTPGTYDNKGTATNVDQFRFKATITYEKLPPSVTATITPTGYATFSSPYALDFSDAIDNLDGAYYASAVETGKVTMTKLEQAVPAETGLFLKGTAGKTVTIPVVASGTEINGNYLKPNTTSKEIAASTENAYHYVFAYTTSDNSNPGFFNLASPATLGAGKAYIETATSIKPTAGAKVSILFTDTELTGIVNAEANETTNAKTGKI